MKHLSCTYDEKLFSSSVTDFYFKDMKIGVLDIETTGLNPSHNKFILGGIYDCVNFEMHQYFAENRTEESLALAGFLKRLSDFDMVITYNGKHFDLPFIEKRYNALSDNLIYASRENNYSYGEEKNDNIISHPTQLYNLDLYLVLNKYSPVKRFVPNLKQKTVENYMGLWQTRKDEISGSESVELYNEYEKTQDRLLCEKILLHNSDDVMQLTKLVKVIQKCDFHKAMFHLGFPVGNLTINKIILRKDSLDVNGIQRISPFDYMGFSFDGYPAETIFRKKDSSFSLRFPIIRQSGMAVLDLEAAHIDNNEFTIYPGYGSGFLIIEKHGEVAHMEINHFIKCFLRLFMEKSS